MILFQLTLSPAMIRTMQYIQAGSTGFDTESDADKTDHLPQFLNSVRRLQAEGLVKWYPSGDHSKRWVNPDGSPKKEGGPYFAITRKGELALELVALEVSDVQALLLPSVKAIPEPKKRAKK
jgi:hypothetical protein